MTRIHTSAPEVVLREPIATLIPDQEEVTAIALEPEQIQALETAIDLEHHSTALDQAIQHAPIHLAPTDHLLPGQAEVDLLAAEVEGGNSPDTILKIRFQTPRPILCRGV